MSLSEKTIGRVGAVFEEAQLGDPRRVRRAVGLAVALAQRPRGTLPQVWESPADLEAGYRFLRNPRTDFESLMESIQLATRDRALAAQRVLVLHDTTDVTCPAAEPDEVGYLQTGKAGFFVHHALCVSADAPNVPLGILWSQLWGRAQRSKKLGNKRAGSELAKLEERESDRWLEGLAEAEMWAQGCDEVVHVMDREADAVRVFELATELGASFVVRLRHDRRTADSALISEELARAPVRYQKEVTISSRTGKNMPRYTHKAREARRAKVTIRCATVRIAPPRYAESIEPITINIVQALEENPPAKATPVSWVLATSLPIKTKAQLERVLDIYCARWLIEEFHKALKTGCMLEKRQLESFQSLTTLLAMSYPIAAELLRVRARARTRGIPVMEVFRATFIECLRAYPKARPLPDDPTADDVLSVIATLGGHQKHNGPPGWQTLAVGYGKILEFEAGWIAAKAHQTSDQ
jgi:hypothetical protein